MRDAAFNRLTVPSLPSEAGFVVALRLAGQPEEFREDATRLLRAHLLGPDMEDWCVGSKFQAGRSVAIWVAQQGEGPANEVAQEQEPV
jgi:hypothetical protein